MDPTVSIPGKASMTAAAGVNCLLARFLAIRHVSSPVALDSTRCALPN